MNLCKLSAIVCAAFAQHCAVFPPPVFTEILSDHKIRAAVVALLKQVPLLSLKLGFWERAGLTRSRILRRGLKARLADTLIAQVCIDCSVPLITRDADYRHFVRYAGLRLFEERRMPEE